MSADSLFKTKLEAIGSLQTDESIKVRSCNDQRLDSHGLNLVDNLISF